eukprot:3312196-Rhodomonas_salina.1
MFLPVDLHVHRSRAPWETAQLQRRERRRQGRCLGGGLVVAQDVGLNVPSDTRHSVSLAAVLGLLARLWIDERLLWAARELAQDQPLDGTLVASHSRLAACFLRLRARQVDERDHLGCLALRVLTGLRLGLRLRRRRLLLPPPPEEVLDQLGARS